eukprot:5014668-Pleurochrysis_carterae.AAC.1
MREACVREEGVCVRTPRSTELAPYSDPRREYSTAARRMRAALNNSEAVNPRRIAGSVGGGAKLAPVVERGDSDPDGGEGGADGGASFSRAGSRTRCAPATEGALRSSTWEARATAGTTWSWVGSVGALE